MHVMSKKKYMDPVHRTVLINYYRYDRYDKKRNNDYKRVMTERGYDYNLPETDSVMYKQIYKDIHQTFIETRQFQW